MWKNQKHLISHKFAPNCAYAHNSAAIRAWNRVFLAVFALTKSLLGIWACRLSDCRNSTRERNPARGRLLSFVFMRRFGTTLLCLASRTKTLLLIVLGFTKQSNNKKKQQKSNNNNNKTCVCFRVCLTSFANHCTNSLRHVK